MPRTDKAKNIDKVAASLAKNPLQTEREVEKDTWVSQSSVNRAKKVLGQIGSKDPRIVSLTDWDFDIMEKIQKEKLERLEWGEKINNSDLDRWEQTATKRYSLFRGSVTDDKWWLNASWLSDSELLAMIND